MIHKILKNGIKLAVVPIEGLRAVTVEASVKIGAKYEEHTEHGLSHFLEHMAFKGTLKRPKQMDVFQEMDVRGADFNAETGLENTSYSITTVRSNLDWAVDMLNDIIFNSIMPEDEVKKERGVICEEIKMYKDNPMMGLGSEMMKFVFGKSKLGCFNISGELDQIQKVNREDIINFQKKYFDTEAMTVVLAGNVQEADVKLVETMFAEVRTGKVVVSVPIDVNPQKTRTESRQVEGGHLALAVPSFGWESDKRHAARLLDIILSGNSSSRLFSEIRSNRGWAYYVFPISEMFREAGMWGVQAGVSLANLNDAVKVIKEILLNVGKTISEAELTRAKTYLNGRIELHLDQSDFWSGYVGSKWLLEDRLTTPTEELKLIEKTTLDEIRSLANDMFKEEEIREMTVLAK